MPLCNYASTVIFAIKKLSIKRVELIIAYIDHTMNHSPNHNCVIILCTKSPTGYFNSYVSQCISCNIIQHPKELL